MSDEVDRLIQQIKIEKDVVAKARIIDHLKSDLDVKASDIARKLGFSPTYVSNLIRLLRLPPIILDGYYAENLSATHLFIISRLHNKQDMIDVYEQVLSKSLTTQLLEDVVREQLYNIQSKGERLSSDEKKAIEDVFKKINKNFKIRIIQTRIKAKIQLEIKGSLSTTSESLKKLSKELL